MIGIGVDIGGTSTKVGFVNENGIIEKKFSFVPKKGSNQDRYLTDLANEINDFTTKNYSKNEIKGIGVGCAGVINSKTGHCDYAGNLKWFHAPIKEIFEKEIGIHTIITNDANAALLAEARFGSGKNYHNLVLLSIGTGLGGGLYLNDQIYEGNEGKGAELGHAKIVLNGRKCTCGFKGCCEAYVSCTALIKDTKKEMRKHKDSLLWKLVDGDISKVDAKVPFDGEKANDPTSKKIIDNYIMYLSETIISFGNIFRPEAFILSGGITKQGDNLTSRITNYLAKNKYGFNETPGYDILISKFSYEAGMIGAACLVL